MGAGQIDPDTISCFTQKSTRRLRSGFCRALLSPTDTRFEKAKYGVRSIGAPVIGSYYNASWKRTKGSPGNEKGVSGQYFSDPLPDKAGMGTGAVGPDFCKPGEEIEKMLFRWIPWKFFIARAARAHGFIDPIQLMARLRGFSQPSEVQEPIELLRAGIMFQARGLVNTRVIQYNLDWVWPFWVERQYNPDDPSFVPRAFSVTHINLTQRNWTAVGVPDLPVYPIVDPRGLVTPLFDGWSIDFWLLSAGGARLLPSRLDRVDQRLAFDPELSVKTTGHKPAMSLTTEARLVVENGRPEVDIRADANIEQGGRIAVVLRPYNPEGVSFIEKIDYAESPPGWTVDDRTRVLLDRPPKAVHFSNFENGDVLHGLDSPSPRGRNIRCRLGLATSAALYPVAKNGSGQVTVRVPLPEEIHGKTSRSTSAPDRQWHTALKGTCRLSIPDEKISYLFQAALRTLVILSAGEIYPGPYSYRRFWFRDACLMLHALLVVGLTDRAERSIDGFPAKQKRDGYFRSQEGEWDSNGQVLWIMDRFWQLTAKTPKAAWIDAAKKGARWIAKKRLPKENGQPHGGLLPAGFSAEHLGPNDYYFWDDFWSIAGLQGAARLVSRFDSEKKGRIFAAEAADLAQAVYDSVEAIPRKRSRGGIPASPYRRMDAGAIGSMVADYPLQLMEPKNPRIASTLTYLLKNAVYKGGFFQDMIHSGINVYLTLALAQTLLRNEDPRHRELIRTAADLASPTGQWPEAIHPRTGGGCMGDGQHGWAAAEWIMMVRNLFVREENGGLVIGAGIFPEWLADGSSMTFGPTATCQGRVRVVVDHIDGRPAVKTEWKDREPGAAEIRIPGCQPAPVQTPGEFQILAQAG